MGRMIWGVLVIAACGPAKSSPKDPVFETPAWAADYEKRATVGCACTTSECLNSAHDELGAIERGHGGMDEAPPGVHAAHGKFDTCWRDGTRDITRDMEFAAQTLCTCATSECLRLGKIELAGLVDGKYRENLDADLAANPGAVAAIERSADCIEKVTMPAAAALAAIEATSNAMCACTDFACAQTVMKDRGTAFAGYLDFEATLDRTAVSDASARYCKCLEKVATNEIKNLSPVPSMTSVDISMKCN